MPENRYSRRIPDQIWDRHKSTIVRLYLSENRPLTAPGGVKDIMYFEHGFSATKAQYETKLKKWRSFKYASAHDRHNQASILEGYEWDDLNTEGHIEAPDVNFRNIAIRTSSPHRPAMQSASLSPRMFSLVPSTSSSLWHGLSSVPVSSVTFRAPTRCDVESFFPQHHTWSHDMTSGTFGMRDSAWSVLDSFPSHATNPLSYLAIPDLATSMIPVIARLFPRASSAAHVVLFGDKAVLESAIVSTSHPSALPLVREQSMDHQIIYMIIHHLINHDDVVRTLEKPKTKLDHVLKAGITYCFSLGPDFLSSIIESTPSPYDLALIQSVFRAALFLGDGPIVNVIMSLHKALATLRVLLNGFHYYPLHYTSFFGHVKATKVLLDHGTDPNLAWDLFHLSSIGSMPVSQRPSAEVRVQILRLLISHGLRIDPFAAMYQVKSGSTNELELLVTCCLDKSFETFFTRHALPVVLLREEWDDSSSRTIGTIIERAASDGIGHQTLWDSVLTESLSCALLRRHVSAVDILLTMGAKPNVNCLISAARSNNLIMFQDFLDRGLDPNSQRLKPFAIETTDPCMDYARKDIPDRYGTATSEAIKNHSRAALQVLRERGLISKLADQPNAFVPAFVAACQVGDMDLIEYFLSLRSFPARLPGMEKALKAALEEHQHHILEKLLSVGITPTLECLELAVRERQLVAVKMLVNCMDLPEQLGTGFGTLSRYETMDGAVYANGLFFRALQWNDPTAVDSVFSMGYPVDALYRLGYDKPSDWNLPPELYSPENRREWSLTPLSAAVLKSNTAVMNALIAYGIQAVSFKSQFTSYKNLSGAGPWTGMMIITPLAASAIRNDVHLIKELLRVGADPFDNSALFVSVILDLPDIVTLLLDAFKSRYPDGVRSFGCEALYQIIRRKNLPLLRLLASEIDITGPVAKDRGQRSFPDLRPRSSCVFTSPLGEAIRLHAESSGSDVALDFLLPLVKDYDAIVYRDLSRCSMTCVLYSIFLDSLFTVRKLHDAGANLSLPATSSMPRTPLQAAAQAGSKDIVEYVLDHGADPNEPPAVRAGATALQLAAITGNIAVAKLLLEAGAEINAPPAFGGGRTAFEGATEHGRIAMMIFLVDEGVDLLANSNVQYRRAVVLAEDNRQYAAKDLADRLFARALASQQAGFLGMGEPWAGAEMPDFGTLFS